MNISYNQHDWPDRYLTSNIRKHSLPLTVELLLINLSEKGCAAQSRREMSSIVKFFHLVWCYLRVPSNRLAMVSRNVFCGAKRPFITGILPASHWHFIPRGGPGSSPQVGDFPRDHWQRARRPGQTAGRPRSMLRYRPPALSLRCRLAAALSAATSRRSSATFHTGGKGW